METSLVTLQACQLIGCLSLAEADAATEAICSAIACRVAQLLDLPHRLSSNSLERELEIRGKTALPNVNPGVSLGNPRLTICSILVNLHDGHVECDGQQNPAGIHI